MTTAANIQRAVMPLLVRACSGRSAKTCGSCGGALFPARPGGPHCDLDVAGAVPGYLPDAQPPVESLGAVVDGEHVQDEVLALVLGLVDERADQAGTDAAALMAGMDLDAGEVDLAGTVFDVEHADVRSAGGDDLPAALVKPAGVVVMLALFVPSPDRGDVAAHGGFVQLEAELAVGKGWPAAARCQSSRGVPGRGPARETACQQDIAL